MIREAYRLACLIGHTDNRDTVAFFKGLLTQIENDERAKRTPPPMHINCRCILPYPNEDNSYNTQ